MGRKKIFNSTQELDEPIEEVEPLGSNTLGTRYRKKQNYAHLA